MAETQIVVEAWAVLIAAGAIVASMLGTSLGIMFQLGGRIDHQSDRIDHQSDRIDHQSDRIDHQSRRIDDVAAEVALVRERVARLEGTSGSPDPSPLQLA